MRCKSTHYKSVCLPTVLLCAQHEEQLSHVQACHFHQICENLEDEVDPDPHPEFSAMQRRPRNWSLTVSAFSHELAPGLWFSSSHLWTGPACLLPCTMQLHFALSLCLSGCLPSGRPRSHLQYSPNRVTDLLATNHTNTHIVSGAGCMPGFSQLQHNSPIWYISTWMHNQLSIQ